MAVPARSVRPASSWASVSPDGRFVLRQPVQRPYSYVVPVSSFPRRIEVIDRATGKLVHTVAVRPLVEGLPTGNDAEVTGVRDISWRGDADATLVWAEAQDGGDPNQEAKVRDAVLMQAAPFDKPPVTLAQRQPPERHQLGPWRPGPADRVVVEDPQDQDLADRPGQRRCRAAPAVGS